MRADDSIKKFQIVLAWLSTDVEVVRQRRADLGESPVLRQVVVSRAAMWLRKGTDIDLAKAKAYAKSEKGNVIIVFTYPLSEKDPLGRAKKEALKHASEYGVTVSS